MSVSSTNPENTSPSSGPVRDPGLSDLIPRDALIGGQYKLLDRLGRGGMGDIFKAVDTVLERPVAIKFLRPRETAMLESEERFRREARLLSRLNHPNLVVIHSFGHLTDARGSDDDAIKYIVMEYVAGEDLDDMLARRGRLDATTFCKIMAQVCSAVSEAHRAGIVHRDLKPANVIVTQVGGDPLFVKVLDFGLAKVFEAVPASGPPSSDDLAEPQLAVSRAGVCIGTPIYMSPEQARGMEVDGRSDVYSLGIMACQLLTGRLPLERSSTRRQILAHLLDEPVLPGNLRPELELTPEIDEVFARALEKEPEDRFQTVEELAQALLTAVGRWDDPGAVVVPPLPSAAPTPDSGDTFDAEATLRDVAPIPRSLLLQRVSSSGFGTSSGARYQGDAACVCVDLWAPPADDPRVQEETLDCLGVVANRLHQCVTTYAGWSLGPLADRPILLWGHDSGDDTPGAGNYVERAMDAALAIRTSLSALRHDPSLTEAFQRDFRFRVALDVGQVAVADFGPLGPAIHGAPADAARALADEAAYGEIWATEAAFGRVARIFEAVALTDSDSDDDDIVYEVRGKNKLAGWLNPEAALGLGCVLLGRDAEREELHSALVEIVAMNEPRVVILAGPLGMGKDVLVSDFIRDVGDLAEPHAFHIGRCAQANEGSPFQPFVEALRHHAHIRIDDPEAVARTKLLEFIREHAANDPSVLTPEERKMQSLLEALLGIAESQPLAMAAVQGDEARRTLLFDAVTGLYRRLAQHVPIVFIIKDFELATAATKALVSHLAARLGNAPVLLLLIAESRTQQPLDLSFFRDPNAVSALLLDPLDRETTEETVRETLADMAELPDFVVSEIARVAGGRPWFVEEAARCLADRGTLQLDFGEWVLTDGSRDAVALPDTFEEIFADRLERLPSGLRRALDVAAVAGRFWPQMLLDLAGERVSDRAVFELQRRGFIEERGEYVVGGEHDYGIVRRTMRQALYRWLDPGRRQRLHGAVGDWLDARAVASMVHDARIGQHYRLAGRWFEALPFTLRAARMARRTLAVEFATELWERCLELLDRCPDSDELTAADKADIRLEVAGDLVPLLVEADQEDKAITVAGAVLGMASVRSGGFRDAKTALRAATVALWMGRALHQLDQPERADMAFQAAERLLGSSADRDVQLVRLKIAVERAMGYGAMGDLVEAHKALRMALMPETVSALDGTQEVAIAYVELANAEAALGHTQNALRHYDKALKLAHAANAPAVVVDALTDKGRLHQRTKQARKAQLAWTEALAMTERWDLLRRRADILVEVSRAALDAKKAPDAHRAAREARSIYRHLSCDEGLAGAARMLTLAQLAAGRVVPAARAAGEAIAAAEALGDALVIGLAHEAMAEVTLRLMAEADDGAHHVALTRHIEAGVAAYRRAGEMARADTLQKMGARVSR